METSAGGIVFRRINGITEWLVIQHAGKGHWGFPKGHVGDTVDNESRETAAVREVLEEGGIVAKIVHPLPFRNEYFYTYAGEKRKKQVFYFVMEYISGDCSDHDDEVSEARWLAAPATAHTLTFPSEKAIFQQVIKLFH